jgi:hypothetical protein
MPVFLPDGALLLLPTRFYTHGIEAAFEMCDLEVTPHAS